MRELKALKTFLQLVVTSGDDCDAALAIAASRAGAVGLFRPPLEAPAAAIETALEDLARHARHAWGLALTADEPIDLARSLKRYTGDGLAWLVLTPELAAQAAVQRFRRNGGRVIVAGAQAPEAVTAATADAVLIEAGDGLGAKLAASCAAARVPVYATGDLGVRAHAVCFCAGVEGIVYGSQLAAVAESPTATDPAGGAQAGARAAAWAARYGNVAGALKAVRRALRADIDVVLDRYLPEPREQLVLTPTPTRDAASDDDAVPVLQCGRAVVDGDPALRAAADAWAKRPWGVELAGDDELGDTLRAARAAGASFALLRDARPDQAVAGAGAELPVFLPVHSPSLMALCLRQGVTHFLLAADTLEAWEGMVDALAAAKHDGKGKSAAHFTVLLPLENTEGDAALRAAALLAPLAALGVHTGLVVAAPQPAVDRKAVKALRKRRRGLDPARRRQRRKPADIAIVGIGCKLPRAGDGAEFWENMLDRVNGIREIPADRWDWRLYFDDDRHAEDRIYSRWGGFLDDVEFDPMRFGMPPKSIRAIDPMQLMALEVVRQTLEDAGYATREFDRERVSVVLGATGGTGDVGSQYAVRAETPRYAGELPEAVAGRLPEWTEDSFAGILLNVTAGRAANRFDFGGVNFTVDSACASSLTAVYQAVTELEAGRADMAIAGGVDTVQGPFGYLCFSKTQALSPRGQCSTFDQSADGIVISEGIAMVALKRLADAERDGDRIYAVIKGVGGSSDGRARSMTAPHPDGQIRALKRAYEHAGYSPASVGLFEAHGTGTVAGDTAELETVIRVLDEAGAQPRSTVIGSVKTLIGHTKGTAGIAGLVKTALAVYHGVQPPHANVTHPNERIARDDCPVTLLPAPRPWVTPPGAPRRASVSAFGFGGTNFHVTMEQYLGDYLPELKPARRSRWPAELLVWRGADAAALAAAVRATAGWLATNPAPALRDLAWTLQHRAPAEGLTACLVAATVDDLPARLTALAAHVVEEAAPLPDDAYFSREPLAAQGKLAVVFAGQGSQYPGMLRQVAVAFDDVAVTLAAAEATLGRPFSALAYPAGCYDAASERAAAEALAAPGDGLPTLAAVQIGMLNLFRRLGVAPAMAAGHSFGEHAALHAAGALELADVFRLAQARGDVLSAASDSYALARVACDYAALAEAAAEVGDVWVASHTAPGKCAVSGVRSAVLAVLDRLGLSAQTQPTSMAVHTPLAAAQARRLFRETPPESCNTPKIPVYCNATGQPYPEAPDALLAEFAQQMARPVRFVEQIEAMYADGARIFLGLGPRNGQGSPIVDILGDRPCLAVHVDDGEGGMKGLLRCAGALLAEGVALDLEALNGGRNCALLDLHRPGPGGPGERRGKRSPRHCWLLNGSQARPAGEAPREPLRHVAQADSTMDFKTQVPEEKGTGDKWESNTMSTSARDLPAQLLEPAADEAQEMLVADERDVVFQAYQDTMRQFLASQESVMLAYLGGAGATATSALPAPAAPRRLAAPRTVVRRPAPIPMRVAEPPVATAPASRPAAPAPVAAPVAAPVVEAPAPTPVASKPVAAPPAAPAPAPAPAAPAATTGGSLDAENVRKQLLELVEERTGYPQDMLDLDQHIEADLGIDSIKRVEIVGALIKTLPADVVSANSGLSDELNSQTTLQGMIDLVSQQGGLAAASNQ